MKYLLMLLSLMLAASCVQPKEEAVNEVIPVVDFQEFKPMLYKENDSLYLINFWATWCKPCIEEMPYFEKINELYKDQKVKVVLVSLDNPDQLETRLMPFIRENGLRSQVILLDDVNANAWIPQVDDRWSGAIPATVFYGSGFRDFYEKPFKFPELDSIVKSKL